MMKTAARTATYRRHDDRNNDATNSDGDGDGDDHDHDRFAATVGF